MVEHVFAVGMVLGVERHRANSCALGVARDQMRRAASRCACAGATALFQRLQKIPGEKWIERRAWRIGQRVPRRAVNAGEPASMDIVSASAPSMPHIYVAHTHGEIMASANALRALHPTS